MKKIACVAAIAALAIGLVSSTPSSDGSLERDVRVAGPADRYTIATRILRPAGLGPFPAVILNHGHGATARSRRSESPQLMLAAAHEFVRRGYVVVLPTRSGFGATGGVLAEDPGSCDAPDYLRGMAAAAEDVLAVYRFAQRLPFVDGSRMILGGQSAGGVVALAVAAREPAGLAAVIAFAAGMGGNTIAHPGEACAPEEMAALFAHLGRHVKVPVLLNYASNDRWFGQETSRVWYENLRSGGAPAQYVLLPAFGADGHFIFTDGRGAPAWVPQVAGFLRRIGLSFEDLRVAAGVSGA
jgi:dienelactone hydrolase